MKLPVYNLKNEKVGDIDVNDRVFGAEVSEPLMYEVVKAQLASRRAGTASTKVRSEVSGSSKKLYKQKGTGNARHGSIRAPIYVGGGQVFGPKPRDYSYRPTRQMRVGALRSAVSMRAKEGDLVVLDAFALDAIKTKSVAGALGALSASEGSLIVDGKENVKLEKSTRNLAKHKFLSVEGVNVYDVLKYPKLVLTRAAVEALEKRCQ